MVKFTESCVTLAYDPQNPSNGQTFISLNMILSQSNIHENNADNHQKKLTEPVRENGIKNLLISKPPHSTLFCSQLSQTNPSFSLGLLPLRLVPAVRPSSEGVSFRES